MTNAGASNIELQNKVLLEITEHIINRTNPPAPSKDDALKILVSLRMAILAAMTYILSISILLTSRQRIIFEFLDSATDYANASESGRQEPVKMFNDLNGAAIAARNSFIQSK
jgi:hypothetical protein